MTETRSRFFAEIEEVRDKVVAMGRLGEETVKRATEVLVSQDITGAQVVEANKATLYRSGQEIEALSLHVLAVRQPVVATDLRLIAATMTIVADLQHIGLHSVDLTDVARRMQAAGVVYEPIVDLEGYSERAQKITHRVTDAFGGPDAFAAHAVIEANAEADAFYHASQITLRQVMQERPDAVLPASYLLFATHYIERICNHCANIAERTLFMIEGNSGLRDPTN